MTKIEARNIFGTKFIDLARALGLTKSAISKWPDNLSLHQQDQVTGAAFRLGKLK